MTLPSADNAVVDPEKVRDYLLSFEHPIGRAKARFFRGLGFTPEAWQDLQAALVAHARTGEAELGQTTPFGTKYTVQGALQSPTGGSAFVMSVWIVLSLLTEPPLRDRVPGR